ARARAPGRRPGTTTSGALRAVNSTVRCCSLGLRLSSPSNDTTRVAAGWQRLGGHGPVACRAPQTASRSMRPFAPFQQPGRHVHLVVLVGQAPTLAARTLPLDGLLPRGRILARPVGGHFRSTALAAHPRPHPLHRRGRPSRPRQGLLAPAAATHAITLPRGAERALPDSPVPYARGSASWRFPQCALRANSQPAR